MLIFRSKLVSFDVKKIIIAQCNFLQFHTQRNIHLIWSCNYTMRQLNLIDLNQGEVRRKPCNWRGIPELSTATNTQPRFKSLRTKSRRNGNIRSVSWLCLTIKVFISMNSIHSINQRNWITGPKEDVVINCDSSVAKPCHIVLDGETFDSLNLLSPESMQQVLDSVTIFASTNPERTDQFLEALQQLGRNMRPYQWFIIVIIFYVNIEV